jgi:hypothetical protein
MAKHGDKKLIFNFPDSQLAAFFLDFIQRKTFHAQVLGSMNIKNQIQFKINGSSENVKVSMQKIMVLYHKALDVFEETHDIKRLNKINDMDSDEDSDVDSDEEFT